MWVFFWVILLVIVAWGRVEGREGRDEQMKGRRREHNTDESGGQTRLGMGTREVVAV